MAHPQTHAGNGSLGDKNIADSSSDAPANAVTAAPLRKDPPPEKPESVRMRTLVVFSFWSIVLLLGLPIWWKTTNIYRAPLPLNQMTDWAEGRVCWQFAKELIQPNADCYYRHADRFFHSEY